MSFRWIGFSVVVALMLALAVGGVSCKQGSGERCQIDDDCEDGLVCNASNEVCQAPGSDTADANTTDSAPPVDGAVDATPVDAQVSDAMVDAQVNDAAVFDAAVFDAAP